MFLSKSAVTKVQAIVIVAVILVAAIVMGVFIFQAMPPAGPSSSPAPTPPPPSPSPRMQTPPPQVWPLDPTTIDIFFSEGFNFADGEYAYESPVPFPVIRQGTSGNVTLTVSSSVMMSNVSFSLDDSQGKELKSIKYEFNPSIVNIPAHGKAVSTLTLEVAEDAPSDIYLPGWRFKGDIYWPGMNFEDEDGAGSYSVGDPFLVFPYVPSCIFDVAYALTPSYSWKPEIPIEKGGKAHILFFTFSHQNLSITLTYPSGTLPEGIKAETTEKPLARTSSLLLTLTVDPETPEGIYEIIAKGTVNQNTFERTFNLKVVSGM